MPDEVIKQIERFHDSFAALQLVQDNLNKLAANFYTTGDWCSSQFTTDLAKSVEKNSITMRDAFTYMITIPKE